MIYITEIIQEYSRTVIEILTYTFYTIQLTVVNLTVRPIETQGKNNLKNIHDSKFTLICTSGDGVEILYGKELQFLIASVIKKHANIVFKESIVLNESLLLKIASKRRASKWRQ